MKEIHVIKCDSCGYLQQNVSQIRTCGFCEQEGCIECVRHRITKKGLINTWLHTKNTSNYGRSCMEEFELECKARSIDPDL